MRVLITGGLGFVGSSLAEELLAHGHDVLTIDNLDDFYDPKVKLANLKSLTHYPRFTNYIFDAIDTDRMIYEMKNWHPDVVFHAAGKAGVRPSLKNPQSYVHSNISVLVSVLEAMRACDLKKMVFCSSSSVYGKRDATPAAETEAFDSAISFYATSKQCGELINQMYHNLYGFSFANLRFFTVYGPRQRPDLAIHKFLKAAINSEPITLFGDGSMQRDYTYISDIVSGSMSAIDFVRYEKEGQPRFETFNLGSSSPVNLLQLIAEIENVTGKKMVVNHIDAPAGDVPCTFADTSKARELLGFEAKTTLTQGLSNFYNHMLMEELGAKPTRKKNQTISLLPKIQAK